MTAHFTGRSRGLRNLEGHDRAICPSCEDAVRINPQARPIALAVHDAGVTGECPASGWFRCLSCRAETGVVEQCDYCNGRGWSPGVTGLFENAGGRRVRIDNGPARPGFTRVAS